MNNLISFPNFCFKTKQKHLRCKVLRNRNEGRTFLDSSACKGGSSSHCPCSPVLFLKGCTIFRLNLYKLKSVPKSPLKNQFTQFSKADGTSRVRTLFVSIFCSEHIQINSQMNLPFLILPRVGFPTRVGLPVQNSCDTGPPTVR